ncbi:hypothetical protein [Streptomyces uncialis]|uniref:hypothetical protein n=1 Tax=Streptomyces uncialis TaxID=1048205 RepID=UPI00386A1B15|nr:hypothetical protein OG268_07570 [Streptomyces uncialis]
MSHVVEITRVAVKPGEEDALVADRPAMLKAFARDRSGFRGAYLTRLDGGDWLDIVLWETAADADASHDKGPNLPEIGAFFSHIAELKSMEHANVVHVPGVEHLEPGQAPGVGS